ncbi:PREDICTED: thymocyte selection-associated high mobility group box protein TOX-like, partial [Diuraphis noxia]|uniref:thymocyte selection-associated high mobility group box protein TOX-like n=1 Tax=Diuraphis noxia TaxID=143948 RepID=UPI000763B783
PVSAYALFFRDTQAAIKGKNPNASFGEVSKIVASMWDSLDADHKNLVCSQTFSLIIYISKGKHFKEKKSTLRVLPLFCFVFHSYTISIRMKNSNPFLGVPSVSSNTLIKPNTEKRKTDRDEKDCGGVEMR